MCHCLYCRSRPSACCCGCLSPMMPSRSSEIHQDPEVIARKQVTLTAPPGGIEVGARNVDRMLRHWDRRGYGQWAVVERATARVIGCVGFLQPDDSPISSSAGLSVGRAGATASRRKRRGRRSTGRGAPSTIDHVMSLIGRTIRVDSRRDQDRPALRGGGHLPVEWRERVDLRNPQGRRVMLKGFKEFVLRGKRPRSRHRRRHRRRVQQGRHRAGEGPDYAAHRRHRRQSLISRRWS